MDFNFRKLIERSGEYFLILSLSMLGLAIIIHLIIAAFPALGCEVGGDTGIEIYCRDIQINTPVEYILNIPGFYSFWVFSFIPLLSLAALLGEYGNINQAAVLALGLAWFLLVVCALYYVFKSGVRNFRLKN